MSRLACFVSSLMIIVGLPLPLPHRAAWSSITIRRSAAVCDGWTIASLICRNSPAAAGAVLAE
jgi:hypothetical protein